MTIISVPGGKTLAALAVATTVGIAGAYAQQPPSGPPNALQGFSQNRDKPIKITSATLEVRDKDKMATFAGDVHLVQGDTTMRSKTLVVFYEDDATVKPGAPSTNAAAPLKPGTTTASAAAPAKPGTTTASATQAAPQQSQQIKRVEAKGNVIVVQKDQTATGDLGVFDMHANTVTMLGNVVISQGPNVVRGDTLTVDMTTGVSRISCGKAQENCRVQGLFQPGAMKQMQEAAPAPARETPRPRPSQTQGLSAQPRGLY
jgi:lipopolysaccharide export system protein LptA